MGAVRPTAQHSPPVSWAARGWRGGTREHADKVREGGPFWQGDGPQGSYGATGADGVAAFRAASSTVPATAAAKTGTLHRPCAFRRF